MEVHRPAIGNILYLCGEGIALGHYMLHISFSSPSRTLFCDPLRWPLLYILSISCSVRIDAADLHVICYSVNCTTAKRCLTPKNTGVLTSRLLLLLQGAWCRESRSWPFFHLANNGIMVMATRPHKL